ncbi:MAG: winged helix-turn-helix domain-containing protein [Promethearchaeota archaeon]
MMKKTIRDEINSTTGRRNKYEIWAQILDLCSREPCHLSKILQKIRLKTNLCKEYLLFLLERNLLETIEKENDRSIMYQTTLRGKEALNDFYKLITKFFTLKKK